MKLKCLTSKFWLFTLCWSCVCVGQQSGDTYLSAKDSKAFSWDVSLAMSVIGESPFFIGANKQNEDAYLDLSVLFDIYYRGFFIQTNKHRYNSYIDGVEVGYELVVKEDYEVDLIRKNYLAGVTTDDKSNEVEGLHSREDMSYGGIRYMRYFDSGAYWVDVAGDIFFGYHRGWVVDSFYSYVLQKRNWDINLGVGASFFSSKTNNYYFSVEPEEVTGSRALYRAGSGYRFQAEVLFQHPISEAWLFNGGVTISHYSRSIAGSPLVKAENVIRAQLGFNYVF